MHKLVNIAISLLTALRSARSYARDVAAAAAAAPQQQTNDVADELGQLAALVNDHYTMYRITEFMLPVKHFAALPASSKPAWEETLARFISPPSIVRLTSPTLVTVNIITEDN